MTRLPPLLALLAVAACVQSSAPESRTSELLYIFGSGSSLFVIDPASGSIVARPGPVPDGKRSPIFSPDSSTMYFQAGECEWGGDLRAEHPNLPGTPVAPAARYSARAERLTVDRRW